MTYSNWQIRPATLEDVDAILAIDRQTELLPHWPISDYIKAISPLEDELPNLSVSRKVFVAESHSGLLGFTVIQVASIAEETTAELESVAVTQAARRSGIGRALCIAAVDLARLRGACRIDLEVRRQSTGAIALYESLDFVSLAERPKYYQNPLDDALLMQLTLVPERG